MHVEDFLSPLGVAVCNNPVTAYGNSQIGGQLAGHTEYVTDDACRGFGQVVERSDMLLGDDDDVLRCSGVDVPECQARFVVVKYCCRDFSANDLTEDTIVHDHLLLSRDVSRKKLAGQTSLLALVAFLLLLFCPCCSSVTRPSDSDLNGIVKMFHHDLRWKYFKSAASRVAPSLANDFLESLEDGEKDLNITEWEIRRVEPLADGKKVRVRVRLKYFRMPSTVLEDETVEQVWEERDNGGWTLVSVDGGPFELEEDSKPDTAQTDDETSEKDQPGSREAKD